MAYNNLIDLTRLDQFLGKIKLLLADKVDKETGKGLSTNDYTTSEKTKLAGIATGAQVNTITGVKGDSESSYRTGEVNITKGNIGLGNVENKSSATIRGELTSANVTDALGYTPPQTDTTYDAMSESEAKTGTANTAKLISAEVLDAAIENKGYTGNVGTITGITMNGASKGTSGVVDLGTVITAHQDISGKLDSSLKGAANGLAELDAQGKVPSSQLPSYVDDVIEYNGQSAFPVTGETGKVYVDTSTNKTYRWSGSAYVIIASDLALGETSSTAYRGDYGASAYAHGVTNKGSAFASGLYKITTNSEGHVTAATAVEKSDITALDIPAQDTTYESKTAASGGTDVSLVTTGEKYTWNNKGTYSKPADGIPASDLASGVIPTVPSAYSSNPAMDGTASAGSSTSWAKGDHVHPTDTTRQAKITASGILKGDGSGDISAATAGTDYGTYSKPSDGIPKTDLASDVQTSLGKADTALQSHQDISGKADKSSVLSLTLAAASWSNETPPVQTLTANGVTADNNILIGVGSSVTSAQYDAACAAKLVCTAQGANSVTITCYGEKPSESIPITLVILG